VLTVRVLEHVREVPREAWDALVGEDDSPFVEHTWLDCLEETGCARAETGWMPRHLALFRGTELVAAAPTYIKAHSQGEFVFDWAWADVADRLGIAYYPKLVVAVPFTPASGARALCAKGEDRAKVIDIFADALRKIATQAGLSSVHVLFSRAEEAALWEAAGMTSRLGIQFHWFRQGATTMQDCLARFDSKRRNTIKREMAQPAKDGVTIETLSPGAIDRDTARAMFALYLTTVDKFYWGHRYLNERFFAQVAERFRDRLAWVVARRDGQIVAGAFNVEKNKTLYGRYWGTHVKLPFLHFNVCYYHGIQHCLARRLDTFEPGAGGEHKLARGFEPTITHSSHWIRDAKLRRVIEPHLAREREKVQAAIAEENVT
jgi:predicted N-acyltransferase